jgi:hypothetical protein
MMNQEKEAPSHRDRLLLVGDDSERRKSLKHMLESCGFEVAEATPGAEAERKADDRRDRRERDVALREVEADAERRYILRVLDKEAAAERRPQLGIRELALSAAQELWREPGPAQRQQWQRTVRRRDRSGPSYGAGRS